ncbi:MAG: sigma 54-interacting transcriptional regulator [Candidatus Binatia bacterium]
MADEPLQRALREANAELLLRIEELSFVRLVGDALAGEVEPTAIGRALVALLRDELSLDLAALWTVDELGSGLRLAALARDGEEATGAGSDAPLVAFSDGLLGQAGVGAVVRVADVASALAQLPAELGGQAAALLHPVTARGRTVAVVALGTTTAGALDAEYDRLLGLIAPAIAMALENAALCRRLADENRTLRAELGARHGEPLLVGASPAFRQLLVLVERLADADITVLVLGESGSGKEGVARTLHSRSRRREGPFVAINCAALPETLLESELFGIERGVATGVDRRPGLVERAHGGTLFLDEIGDMSAAVQAKLLRVLEEREVVRIGGARPIAVDVRVVAATHRDLDALVRAGRFRADLYFRLAVAMVRVPSLAERGEDIALLAHHLVARFGAKHGRTLRLSPGAVTTLMTRPWPGNVRELANVVEHAVVMAEGPAIEPGDLGGPPAAAAGGPLRYRQLVEAAADGAERTLIERALAATDRNRTRAAKLLGIGRRTLLYKLKRYGLA